MALLLHRLGEEEFDDYYNHKVHRYAKALQENMLVTEKEALEKAKIHMNRFLPQSFHTPDHFIFNLIKEENKIGFIWLYVLKEKNSAYLYDIFIQEQYRGNGLGKDAIKVVENWLNQFNIVHFDLHVFGNNKNALRLYEKLGFEVTSIYMRKKLT